METADVKLSARRVSERFGISPRTLDRWLHRPDLKFPRPLVIAGRRYFSRNEIQVWERVRAVASAASQNGPKHQSLRGRCIFEGPGRLATARR